MAKYIHRFGTTQEFENVFYREESTEYTFECSAGTFENPTFRADFYQWTNQSTQQNLITLTPIPHMGIMTQEEFFEVMTTIEAMYNSGATEEEVKAYLDSHTRGAFGFGSGGDFVLVEITAVNSITIEGYKEPWVSYVDETEKVNFNRKPFCTIKTMVDSGSSLVLNDVTECITSAITLDDLLAPTYDAYGSKHGLSVAFYIGDGETNPGSIVPENRFANGVCCRIQGFYPSDFTVESSSPYDFSNGVFDESARGKVITIVWGEYFC